MFMNDYKVGEMSCPTKYFDEASSINFIKSCKYGLEVLFISLLYRLAKCGLRFSIFINNGQKLNLKENLLYYYKKQ